MYNLIGYLFIILLILSLWAFFAISIQIDYKRIKKIAERELNKLDILHQFINLKEQINTKSAKYLKPRTFEHLYLSQIDALLQDNPFQLDKRKISPVNFRKKDCGVDKETFIKVYKKAPACVKQDMETMSEILGKIYQMQHPIKHKVLQVKKIMALRILELLIGFCDFMINKLEKRCESKSQKKIRHLKKKQTHAKNRPSSTLLNFHYDENTCFLQPAI